MIDLKKQRGENWRQDGTHRVADPEAAVEFIDRVGICTHHGQSTEFPSLFSAHMSEAEPKVPNSWDSPAGHVYTWRWLIGGKQAAFYSSIVRLKPTWVSWQILPAVLSVLQDKRTPDELYDLGLLSANSYKVVQAYEGTEGVLTTKELRARSGFPTSKENRAAYLKAVEELESRLLLSKVFGSQEQGETESMSHALVDLHFRSICEQARALDPVEALVSLLKTYVAQAAYLKPDLFAKHLRIDKVLMKQATELAVQRSILKPADLDGQEVCVGAQA